MSVRELCARWQEPIVPPVPDGPLLRFSCECAGEGCPHDPRRRRPVPVRVHLWPPSGFAQLRRYRCGVYVGPGSSAGDLCGQPPLYAAELDGPGRDGRLALCAEHSADAQLSWADLCALWSLAEPAPRHGRGC